MLSKKIWQLTLILASIAQHHQLNSKIVSESTEASYPRTKTEDEKLIINSDFDEIDENLARLALKEMGHDIDDEVEQIKSLQDKTDSNTTKTEGQSSPQGVTIEFEEVDEEDLKAEKAYLKSLKNKKPLFDSIKKKKSDQKNRKKTIRITNPLKRMSEKKHLFDFIKEENMIKSAAGAKEAEFETPSDFKTFFEKNKSGVINNRSWKLIDGTALRIDKTSLTWKELEQMCAVEAFIQENDTGNLNFNPGFSASAILKEEAAAFGTNPSNQLAEEVMENIKAQSGINDNRQFANFVESRYGFSLPIFNAYFANRELSMVMLTRLRPMQATSEAAFKDFLQKRGIQVNVKYDIDVASIEKKDLQNYLKKSIEPTWVNFGVRSTSDFSPTIGNVIEALEDGKTSEPFANGDSYWVVRRNRTEISDDLESISSKMLNLKEQWLQESLDELLKTIGSKPAKTVEFGPFLKK